MTEGRAEDRLKPDLEEILRQRSGQRLRVASVERRPSEYRSTAALDELAVRLEDGTRLELLLKDLGSGARLGRPGGGKPRGILDPRREIELYRNVLEPMDIGTAAFFGSVEEPEQGRYWLFIEKVKGVELFQVGDFAVWESVARWLARFHARWADGTRPPIDPGRLVVYDAAFYRRWISRARTFVLESLGASVHQRRALLALSARYERVVERLVAQPSTLIHGEFYPSNILVRRTGAKENVCPIDWETAAIGPGLVDLAALTSGKWGDEERQRLEAAYHQALRQQGVAVRGPRRFREDLDYCRLHVAVQWLGWARGWSPPPQHAHDWLAEALAAAERVGL